MITQTVNLAGEVNQLYPEVVELCRKFGEPIVARGTHTKELHPVVLEVEYPWQCVVTSYNRPVNLAFAMAEVLWILKGDRDVAMPAFYNGSISQFSDNGQTFNAAYGYRLRKAHRYDQIEDAVASLQEDPTSRRVMLSMWHPDDSGFVHYIDNPDEGVQLTKRVTKDRACNAFAHLLIRDNKLDWTHFVRSNDIILGLPYNFIQFGHLQAYIAGRLGILPGRLTYIADSLHQYEDTYYTDADASGISPFNIYAHAEDPDFMLGMDDYTEVVALEQSIRNGFYYNPRLAEEEDGYWRLVAHLWSAHAHYKNGDDIGSIRQLQGAPFVYAATQARFYASRRWLKLPVSEQSKIFHELGDLFGPEILDWIGGGSGGAH